MKDDNKKEKPTQKLHKTVIVCEGDRVCWAAFADPAQEKMLIKILFPPRHTN